MHPDLLEAIKLAYTPSGLSASNFIKAKESDEYAACDFEMNGRRIKFRIGKITPTKVGQFTTLWKRTGNGPIQPYDMLDPTDLFVVSVRNADHFGQFVFPKILLAEKGIITREGKEGKRAMRIYAPWDIADNKQAKNTQTWQLRYFFEISSLLDKSRVQELFL